MKLLGEWNNKKIRVNPADSDYINATDMCKAAGKKWNHYWTNQDTKDFVDALAAQTGIPVCKLVMPVKGYGTWVHVDIAMDLARWADKKFHVWMIQKTRQLITTGSVIIHREHQEAQLSTNTGPIYQLVSEIRQSNELTTKAFKACDHSNQRCFETLQELTRRSNKQLEKVVQRQLVADEGGVREVELPNGARVDIVIPGQWIVEVKYFNDYKKAIGQIKVYNLFSNDIDLEPRIHLFSKPMDKPPTVSKKERIERECRLLGIAVTWHEWRIEPPKAYQPLLKLSY